MVELSQFATSVETSSYKHGWLKQGYENTSSLKTEPVFVAEPKDEPPHIEMAKRRGRSHYGSSQSGYRSVRQSS
jgi:hypothetical protein